MAARKTKAKSASASWHYSSDKKRTLWVVGDNTYAFPAPQCVWDAEHAEYEYEYDEVEAQRWVDWFENWLFHIEGDLAGQPLKLMPHLEVIIRELFGWRVKGTKNRRYRTGFIFIPRKNAKTLLMAGITLGLLALDDEAKAQVYLGAATQEQAGLCSSMAKDMIEISEDLQELFKVEESKDKIVHPGTRGYIKVMSGVPKGKTGFNVHGAVFDEYHEFTSTGLRDFLQTAIISRSQPLFVYITTAGDDDESPCYKEYELAKAIRDMTGDPDDNYFAFIAEADKDDDPGAVETWKKANPGYGLSVQEMNMRALYNQAKRDPSKFAAFKRFFLNIWVQRTADFLPWDAWQMCEVKYSMQEMLGLLAYGGFDLGMTRDMTAFALCFPQWYPSSELDEDGRPVIIMRTKPRILPWYWAPEAALELYPQYEAWHKEGLLEVTKGNIIDRAHIKRRIREICSLFNVPLMGFDPWRSNPMFAEIEEDARLRKFPAPLAVKTEVVQIAQSYRNMGPAIQDFEDAAVAGQLEHNGHLILNENVKNAQVVSNKDGFKLLQKVQGKRKIDGLVAACIAYKTMGLADPPKPPRPKASVW